MHFVLTFKLQQFCSSVGRKKLTGGRIYRSGEAVIGILFNVSIGCLEEYSMSPSLLYPRPYIVIFLICIMWECDAWRRTLFCLSYDNS